MKNLFIFDLDGTLSDTRPLLNYVFADALTECGFPETEDHIRALVRESGYIPTKDGAHVPVAYRDKIPDNFGLYFWTHYENYYIGATDRLYDGIRETLDGLKTHGHAIAVFSNKPANCTELCVSRLLSPWTFDEVVGQKDGVIPKKPDPAGARIILERWKMSPEEVLYVGDTSTDMKTAQNAGLLKLRLPHSGLSPWRDFPE